MKAGTCAEVTLEMAQNDSSLTRVRGHYICPIWGERAHWWLKTEDGGIIDPTVDQFPSGGCGEYVEWVEGSKEPTGMCMGCGDYVYAGDFACSPKCEFDVMRSLV